MRLLSLIARNELRLQRRTPRFFAAVGAYVAVASAPGLLLALVIRDLVDEYLGPMAYLAQAMAVLPFATVVFAMLVAGNRSTLKDLEEVWGPLASARISNAGWLLRRWLAQVGLIVPVTLVPLVITAGAAGWATGQPIPVGDWLWVWITQVVPLAVVIPAAWLGLVLITGGELTALLLAIVASSSFLSVLRQILFAVSRQTVGNPFEILRLQELQYWFLWTRIFLLQPRARRHHRGFGASDGPFDPVASLEWLVPHIAVLAGLSMTLLALGSAFTRRTRRDHRPWNVAPDHSLRTSVKALNGLRQRYAPDGALAPLDRGALVVGLLIFVLAVGAVMGLDRTFEAQAAERFETLTTNPFPPMSTDFHPEDWRLEGMLMESGEVALEVTGRMVNRGSVPLDELAFMLNAGLEVTALELVDDPRGTNQALDHQSAWDRHHLTLGRPLGPGESVGLRWRIQGVPYHPYFGLSWGTTPPSFVTAFGRLEHARFPRELNDFSRTRQQRSISRRRVDLKPGDLVPVPRYTEWTLTPPSDSPGEQGRTVPPEEIDRPMELTIALGAPESWFLADTCGRHRPPGGGRLEGVCTVALNRLVVRGGEYVVTEGGGLTLALLPMHSEKAEELLASLRRAADLGRRVWPDLPGFEGMVVLEWPPQFFIDLAGGSWVRRDEVIGRLLSLPESQINDPRPLAGENIVAANMARDLMERRDFATAELAPFRSFLQALALQRMGIHTSYASGGSRDGAVLSGSPWLPGLVSPPVLSKDGEFGFETLYKLKLPAVMVEAESRVGRQVFDQVVDTFLSDTEGGPGTFEAFFRDLEAASGQSFETFYQQHFLDRSLPILRVMDVTVETGDRDWTVRGAVRNMNPGDTRCPLLLELESGQTVQHLDIAAKSKTPFTFKTRVRPKAVVLDPGKTCFRIHFRQSAQHERVELEVDR